MTHLSAEQLIDIAEGRSERAAVAHAATCEACRAAVGELRATMTLAQTDGQHEPSPLFWDHFSARVGAAVRAEAERRERRASWVWRWVPLSALAAAVLVAALVIMPRGAARPGSETASPAPSPAVANAATDAAVYIDEPPTANDASWLLMSDLSKEMTADDAGAALPAGPGTADRALGHLTDTERAALVEIIREEIARSSARSGEPSGE